MGGSTAPSGGRLAQLVERFVYTEDVGSSSLSSPTNFFNDLADQPPTTATKTATKTFAYKWR